MTATNAGWAIRFDTEDSTWDVTLDGEVQQSWIETRAEAFAVMKEMRAEAEAEAVKEEIADLASDLGGTDLAKLRAVLKILKA